jgi:Fe-S-cluster-containing hydrogenase component 2
MTRLKINPISGADMEKKLLIDLAAYRSGVDNNQSPAEAIYYPSVNFNGLKTIRELAVFRYTCRKCKDAPCVAVCPASALEKEEDGMITRAVNLCISCKSCVVICPFGTMMTDFFKFKKERSEIFDLNDETQVERFIRESPQGSVSLVDMDENPEMKIYKLNGKVLIKELTWDSENA